MEPFAKRLRRLRVARSKSAFEVALEVGVPVSTYPVSTYPVSTYKEWEYGRAVRGEQIYLPLAKALGVSLTELITGEKPPGSFGTAAEALEKIERELRALRMKVQAWT